jgi:hypothetical protein
MLNPQSAICNLQSAMVEHQYSQVEADEVQNKFRISLKK